jgi:hypothetical protein
MDLLEILFVAAFILFGLFGSRRKRPPTQTPASRPRPRLPPGQQSPPGARTTSPRDLFLQELENLMSGRPAGSAPASPPTTTPRSHRPAPSQTRETLEAPETARWEEGLERAAEVGESPAWLAGERQAAAESQDSTLWEQGIERKPKTLETLEEAGEAAHDRFHEQYDMHAAAPSVRSDAPSFRVSQLRRALVWSEILGPPVSQR